LKLKYAAADSDDSNSENVDCNEILKLIKLNLEFQLKESDGQILFENLPTLKAHKSLMLQVFQNLISNAIKFRKKEISPVVKISGEETNEHYYFKISIPK